MFFKCTSLAFWYVGNLKSVPPVAAPGSFFFLSQKAWDCISMCCLYNALKCLPGHSCFSNCFRSMEIWNTSPHGHLGQGIKGCFLCDLYMPAVFSKADGECSRWDMFDGFRKAIRKYIVFASPRASAMQTRESCLWACTGFRLRTGGCLHHSCSPVPTR